MAESCGVDAGIVVNDRVNGMLAIARALGDFRLKRTISAQMVARAAEAREKGEELPPILGSAYYYYS